MFVGLVFDLVYEANLGITVYLRVFEGKLTIGQKIKFLDTDDLACKVVSLGVNTPKKENRMELISGEIGWFTANIKSNKNLSIGVLVADWETKEEENKQSFLINFLRENLERKPNIYCNLFPDEKTELKKLEKAIKKLSLEDSSLFFELTDSPLLGKGFRCGFIGLLQKEVLCARLEKEFFCTVISTPSFSPYEIIGESKNRFLIKSVNELELLKERIIKIRELIAETKIIVPLEYLNVILQLCTFRRGLILSQEPSVNEELWEVVCRLPFSEFIKDFFNKVKSLSCGYAFLEYKIIGFEDSLIEKVDIWLNEQKISDLSFFVHRDSLFREAKESCENILDSFSKHSFAIVIRAKIGNKVIVRENLAFLSKNVTGNLYGGDRTRKMKLWKKQKKGKKRMQEEGKITFVANDLKKILQKKKE